MPRMTVGLSVSEINKTIRKIEQYKIDLNRRIDLLISTLVNRGVEVAKVNVASMGAMFTGELEASIGGYYSPALQTGIIYAGAWYAVYVEFGTGVRGKEAQHPKAGESGYAYDINNHGEQGWFFTNESNGVSGWTTGMPSRPFMYEMKLQLDKECATIAKTIFRKR